MRIPKSFFGQLLQITLMEGLTKYVPFVIHGFPKQPMLVTMLI